MKNKSGIAIFSPSLEGGGAELVVVNLANHLYYYDKNISLILSKSSGLLIKSLSADIELIDLKSKRVIFSLFKLIKYLQKARPKVLISHQSHLNIIAILAKILAHSHTKLIVCEHANQKIMSYYSPQFLDKILPFLEGIFYPFADAVLAVSQGIMNELKGVMLFRKNIVHLIYNPIITPRITELSKLEMPDWFIQLKKKNKIILSVGRLSYEKDFITLIKSLRLVRDQKDIALCILGEGPQRNELMKYARELHVENNLFMPGFVENPFVYYKNSDVFVLSSVYEGFGNVLVEAMACGIPVISTNCPSGPAEILENGKFGRLVQPQDPYALAQAIVEALDNPPDTKAAKIRANDFTVEKATQKYIDLIESLV